MSIEILRQRDYRIMPWKNGLGSTTELVRIPNDPAHDFVWRVSIASVAEKGPFSLFPGCDRILMPLDGEMVLAHDGRRFVLAPFEAHHFSGEAVTEGWPTGDPVRDFNVIVDRAYGTAQLEVLDANGPVRIEFDERQTGLVFSPSSVLKIPVIGQLQDGDSALVTDEPIVDLQGEGRILLVKIRSVRLRVLAEPSDSEKLKEGCHPERE